MNAPNNTSAHPIEQENLLREDAAARFLEMSPRALQAWRVNGRGPKFVKISGRAVRYRKQDLVAFVEHRILQSTSQRVAV